MVKILDLVPHSQQSQQSQTSDQEGRRLRRGGDGSERVTTRHEAKEALAGGNVHKRVKCRRFEIKVGGYGPERRSQIISFKAHPEMRKPKDSSRQSGIAEDNIAGAGRILPKRRVRKRCRRESCNAYGGGEGKYFVVGASPELGVEASVRDHVGRIRKRCNRNRSIRKCRSRESAGRGGGHGVCDWTRKSRASREGSDKGQRPESS